MEHPTAEDLGAIVKTNLDAWGKVVAYCPHPTVIIEMVDGRRFHWAAHLCKKAPEDWQGPLERLHTYTREGREVAD